MRCVPTEIPAVLIIEPKVFEDERGFFYESFNRRVFADMGVETDFVQDNLSRSRRNVLRGLHYQIKQPQGKLVRVVVGAVFDVAVDMRRSSPTFGRWIGLELSAANRRMAWIPPGFAHGFLTTTEFAEVLYKTTDYWAPEHERTILWNDADLRIAWPLADDMPKLSTKDLAGQSFREAKVFE
jgi:dTDP-4-dehydrorhamnose 3,5-epimerase